MTITAMRGLRYGLEEEFHLDLDQFVSATDVITVKRKLIRCTLPWRGGERDLRR